VRLMARAYAGVRAARCFAPRGTLEEWATYVAQLVKMPACGVFMPSASLAATEAGHDGPRGVLIATSLAPETAHIAQVIVDPSLRRRGVARDLIETTCALVADAGCTRITLLVAEDNTPALELYRAAGFETTAHFLYATRQAPTRVRSARPEGTLVRAVPPAAGRT
jgi:ribosomal protein S18 acetylase RimI-like enzyme